MLTEQAELTIGESFGGSVKKITTAGALRAFGDAVAVIELNNGNDGWYPLSEDHTLTEGMAIRLTPITHHHESGGSTTIYDITQAEEFQTAK